MAPAATAALVVKRFAPMLWLAAGLAVASGIGGLYVSYYADTACRSLDRGGDRRALRAGEHGCLGGPRVRAACGEPAPQLAAANRGTLERDERFGDHMARARDRRAAVGGARKGQARLAVIDLLAKQPCALTAPEIESSLRTKGHRVGLASIYRTLELLADMKLVGRLEVGQGIARYEALVPGGCCSDAAPLAVRRTRAGDAWEAAAAARSGQRCPCKRCSGGGAAAPVLLGMPARHPAG